MSLAEIVSLESESEGIRQTAGTIISRNLFNMVIYLYNLDRRWNSIQMENLSTTSNLANQGITITCAWIRQRISEESSFRCHIKNCSNRITKWKMELTTSRFA
jgi:hypothetical protein